MTGLFTTAVALFVGVFSGICIQWWKSSRDELRILCDDFSKLISEAVELGAAYWASGDDLELKEARLSGLQRKLIGYSVLLAESLHPGAADQIDEALGRFFDALTGGTFSVPNRPVSVENMRWCHYLGADAILEVRRGFTETVSFRGKLWRSTVGRHHRSPWYSNFGGNKD